MPPILAHCVNTTQSAAEYYLILQFYIFNLTAM